jgi:hypothetical protein
MIFKVVNKRKKLWVHKSFFLNLLFPFFLIFLVLSTLPLYTPWIFNLDGKAVRDWLPNPLSFVSFHKNRILNENIASFTNVLLAKEPQEYIPIPTNNIWIENGGLEKMNQELLNYNLTLRNDKPRVKGFLKDNQKNILKARISIRGTRLTHQLIWKPSLKVRLKKNKTFKGFRDQIFIGPEDPTSLKNWISSELGRKWNILNNLENFSRLYINNKNFGLYNTVAPFNESLLINSNKLPGPIFNFNIFNKQKFLIWKKNWFEPIAWKVTEKKYKDDHYLIYGPINTSQKILRWGNSINSGTLENFIPQLNHYISQEQFAKYLAILAHGGEMHYVNNHNAIFWFNPSSGLFEPIINDQNGYGITNKTIWIKRPIIKNEGAFIKAWFKNPLNLAIYIDRLNELINTFGNEKNIETMIRDQWNKIKPVIETEPFSSFSCWPARCFFPINKINEEVNKLINDIRLRLDWIRKELNRDQVILIDVNNKNFEILVVGYSGVIARRKDSKRINIAVKEVPLKNNRFITKIYTKKINAEKQGNIELLPSISISNFMQTIDLDSTYSFYTLSGKAKDYIFSHRLSGKEIKINISHHNYDLNKMKLFSGINYLALPKKNIDPIYFGPGKIKFIETKVFGPEQPVTIRAGTEIHLNKGINLIIQGPLKIKGTSKKPVVIRPMTNEPFGVIALLGKKTKGSRINHLNIEGGSVSSYYNLNFSGMLSVHDCPDIEIRNSIIGKNYLGDDAVHIINSKAIITNSIFKDSKSDALDLDLVEGDFYNNQFINPGNDGLDISMGTTTIGQNRFVGCKDKCVSVGEGAKTNIINSYFQNCNNAIAVKDKSYATLKDSIIDSCNIGWNSYRKKWRWELGGRGEIINTKFINSKSADIAGDKFSSVTISGKTSTLLKIKGKLKINSHKIN